MSYTCLLDLLNLSLQMIAASFFATILRESRQWEGEE